MDGETVAAPVQQALYGHVSPETAYLVDDYPYGRRLRCKIRYWVESKDKHGMRLVSQTTNPKAGHAWNKPKAGTYTTMIVMYLNNENGHVEWAGVNAGWVDSLLRFEAKPFFQTLHPEQRKMYEAIAKYTARTNPRSILEVGQRITVALDKQRHSGATAYDELLAVALADYHGYTPNMEDAVRAALSMGPMATLAVAAATAKDEALLKELGVPA